MAIGFLIINLIFSCSEATRLVNFAPREQTHVAGEKIELPCHADHDENIDVKYNWLVNGKPLPEELIASGHYVLTLNNTLVIPDPAKYDTASYTCVASTRLDNSTKVSTLKIKGTFYISFMLKRVL
jgi:hypothetical protein